MVTIVYLVLTQHYVVGPSAYVYSRHSQSSMIPLCPPGSEQLWDGYSLLHTEDEGRAQVQDLGYYHMLLSYLHCKVFYCIDKEDLLTYFTLPPLLINVG